MNSKHALAIGGAVAVIALVLLVLGGQPETTGKAVLPGAGSQPLRVGWMVSWHDPGIIAEALKNTDILARNNSNAEMVSFSYGPPIVEAALAKQLDATFLGIVPSSVLLAKSNDWIVVGRMVYFNEVLMVKKDSGISDVSGLRGKKIGVPFATGPYPPVFMALEKTGLKPGKDAELINIKPADLPLALETKQVDAVAWGTTLELALNEKHIGKKIGEYRDVGLIMVSKEFAQSHPEQVRNFLKAFKEASFHVAQNKKQTFEWYAKDSSFALSYVESLPLIEPNFEAKSLSEIDISIPASLVESLQNTIDFEYREGIISRRLDIAGVIDQSYLP